MGRLWGVGHAVSIWAPIGYVAFLVGSLTLFSKIYRRKVISAPDPWFTTNKDRDIYYSLLSLEPAPPRPILVAALIRRAMEALRRVWQIRDQKPALNTLLQKGQIGDATWEKFLAAEKELEAEIVEIIEEANTFQDGYGKNLLAFASDMVTHEKWKDLYQAIPAKVEAEKLRSANPVSTPVFGPISHLTPSSLTLYPSNPLSSSPAPPAEPTSPKTAQAALAPPASLPVAPPSPILTPVASTSKSTPPATPSATSPSTASSSAIDLGAGSTPATPTSAAKKAKAKGKKKPPVKGGR